MMTRMQASSSSFQSQRQQQNPRRVIFVNDTDPPSTSKRRFVGMTGGGSLQPRRRAGTITPWLKKSSPARSKTTSTTVIHPSAASIPLYGTNISTYTTNPSVSSSAKATAATPILESSNLKSNAITVLHGRVMKSQPPPLQQNEPRTLHLNEAAAENHYSKQRLSNIRRMSDMSIERSNPHDQKRSSVGRGTSIRDLLERKAVYTQLLEETKQFQQQVLTLENVLKKVCTHLPSTSTAESPDDASSNAQNGWRVRLLLTRAQETDSTLWKKLYEYDGFDAWIDYSNKN